MDDVFPDRAIDNFLKMLVVPQCTLPTRTGLQILYEAFYQFRSKIVEAYIFFTVRVLLPIKALKCSKGPVVIRMSFYVQASIYFSK